jgi:signal transduction histidine kinase
MKARSAARFAWGLWALTIALVVGAFVLLGLTLHTRVFTGGTSRPGDVIFPVGYLVFATVGALVAARHPRNAIGWIFCVLGVLIGVWALSREYTIYSYFTHPGQHPLARLALWLEIWIWAPAAIVTTTFVLLLFPDGRLPSRRWRLAWWLAALSAALLTAVIALSPGAVNDFPTLANPYEVNAFRFFNIRAFNWLVLIPVAAIVVSGISLVLRLRAARGDEREQLKWIAMAGVFLAVVFVAAILGPASTPTALSVLLALAFTSVPVAAGIAILKYRLYDIDLVINRTVMYGVLAAFFTAVYVAIVVGIGAAVGSTSNRFLTILAAVIIAVAFQPVRERARRFANRLVYGKRATPYELLSEFSERLAGEYSTEDVLPRLVRMLVSGTGAQRARVWLRVGDELRLSAAWPEGANADAVVSLPSSSNELPEIPAEPLAFPVRHQGELLGALTVAMPAGNALTHVQEKLLRDISSQAGLMLRNVRLIAELRASRQRLVAAQDAERRRLERNIHDGAQQQLVAFAVKLGLARSLATRDAVQADVLLQELQAGVQDTLDDLRDLARGIYPPLLADQGLVVALQGQARKGAMPVDVDGGGLGRLPQEMEAAIYFCCLEALQNIAKYAGASKAEINFAHADGSLVFRVQDDGRGFDPAATQRGSGLQNMEDRLAALGGTLVISSSPGAGTTLTGTVPLGPTMAVRPEAPVSSSAPEHT